MDHYLYYHRYFCNVETASNEHSFRHNYFIIASYGTPVIFLELHETRHQCLMLLEMSRISRQLALFKSKLVKLSFVFATRRQLIHLLQDSSSLHWKVFEYKLHLSHKLMNIFVESQIKRFLSGIQPKSSKLQ